MSDPLDSMTADELRLENARLQRELRATQRELSESLVTARRSEAMGMVEAAVGRASERLSPDHEVARALVETLAQMRDAQGGV